MPKPKPDHPEPRRFIIEWVTGKPSEEVAMTADKAGYAAIKKLINAQPGLDMKSAAAQIRKVSVHPEDRYARGPKAGTPNPYYQDNPHLLSAREKRRRRIK